MAQPPVSKRIKLGEISTGTTTLFDKTTKKFVVVDKNKLIHDQEREDKLRRQQVLDKLLFDNNNYHSQPANVTISLINVDLSKYNLSILHNRIVNAPGTQIDYVYKYMNDQNIFRLLKMQMSRITLFTLDRFSIRRIRIAQHVIYFSDFKIIYNQVTHQIDVHFPGDMDEEGNEGPNFLDYAVYYLPDQEGEKLNQNLQIQFNNTASVTTNLHLDTVLNMRRLSSWFAYLWFHFTNVEITIH